MRPYSPGGALHGFPTAGSPSASPLPSAHRLRPGLPGYLIPFAPLAFASQRQKTSRTSLSPRAFLPISTHFTAPPEVPGPPTSLQDGRIGARSPVEPGDFSDRRAVPPTRALSPVIPNNVRTVRLTAAAGTNLARASSRDQSRPCGPSSPSTGVYNPKAFVLHAASLGQACAHCRRFSTAASRRSLGSVSVPVCRATLARPVGIIRLGGPLPRQLPNTTTARPTTPELWSTGRCLPVTSLGITRSFPRLYPVMGLVTVALLTLAPLALRPVRLACLIHAANVHSEPGSNPSKLVASRRPERPDVRFLNLKG